MNLDVHLDRRNALCSTCNLEVHIAQEVFHPLDVGQDRHLAASVFFHALDKTHRNTSYRSLDRNACIHQCQTASAYRCLRSRPIRG